MSYLCTAIEKSSMRPDGGIGRRAGLKHQWIHFHPGSTPGLGTEAEKVEILSPFFFWFITKVTQENHKKLVNTIIVNREKPKIKN